MVEIKFKNNYYKSFTYDGDCNKKFKNVQKKNSSNWWGTMNKILLEIITNKLQEQLAIEANNQLEWANILKNLPHNYGRWWDRNGNCRH